MSYSFEEELGAVGGVDAVVEVPAASVFGFGDAGAATAVIGDAGGPDLLAADWREEWRVKEVIGGWGGVDGGGEETLGLDEADRAWRW